MFCASVFPHAHGQTLLRAFLNNSVGLDTTVGLLTAKANQLFCKENSPADPNTASSTLPTTSTSTSDATSTAASTPPSSGFNMSLLCPVKRRGK